MNQDNTKQILQEILSDLYKKQSGKTERIYSGAFLLAQDNQFLGKINDNKYDRDSLFNEYGPYGSKYSQTSIFNKYSQYGSQYGLYSLNNPYCQKPPKMFINENFKFYISNNQYIQNRISADMFLYNLKNNLNGLIKGQIVQSENELRQKNKESFIEGADKVFLGSLNPNQFDNESIFNKFSPYGSEFSPLSIFNKFSNYGSLYSDLSASNIYANNPPKIYVNGNFFAYLTSNSFMTPRINTENVFDWAKKNIQMHY